MSNLPTFFINMCKFCNRITNDPLFPAVVVFTMSFLVAGVIVQSTSALDGGVYCNTLPTQNERAICLKLNGITLILSIAIPIMLAIIVYKIGKDQKSECRLSRKKRLLHK